MKPLSPLVMNNRLAPTPYNQPKYSVTIKNGTGEDESLACPRTTRALVALMNQHAVIGGAAAHWGGPAAFSEIISSLHAIMFRPENKEWYQNYNFVNDAGHTENGIYALRANYGFDGLVFDDLKKFRSIESKLTGHGEAHLNPEGVYISNGPLGSGLPQAQGLAMADKILGNNRITLCTLSDGGSMEGEAKEAFSAIAGLAKKGKLNPFVLLISDNNTKLSGRIDEDSYSMGPTFQSLKILGWDVTFVEEGNDLHVVHPIIDQIITRAKSNSHSPQAIILKTVKGFGVKSTEQSASGGHGYPLKAYDEKLIPFITEIFANNVPEEFSDWAQSILAQKPAAKSPSVASKVIVEKVQPGFARAAIRAVENGLPVFSVTSDLQGSTGISDFHKKFPNHYIDLGIAESNMISAAVGMSKQGLIPIVDTFAQFAITKGNLPLIMAGLSEGPVIGLFSHTGMQDAADGASHQATTYFAATMAIPHVTCISCSCSKEAESYMYQALEKQKEQKEKGEIPDSVLFFFGRENYPQYYRSDLTYEWGRPQLLQEGTDVLIVANGPMVPMALEAAQLLSQQGYQASVVNHPFINKIDLDFFQKQLNNNKKLLITIEDHQRVAGMGQYLVSTLVENGIHLKAKVMGLNGSFGQSAYQASDLYNLSGLNAQGIVQNFMNLQK